MDSNVDVSRVPLDPNTNTEYERLALDVDLNLSDGHARVPLDPAQRRLLASALEYHDEVQYTRQTAIEDAFLHSFFAFAGQSPVWTRSRAFFAYSCSSSIKMVAQYCRLNGLSTHLIEPCFDSIYHLLRREGIQVSPVEESLLMEGVEVGLERVKPGEAIFLVLPNNPTGACLSRGAFESVCRLAAERGALLVVDFSFRFYSTDLRHWDQYAIADACGCSYVFLEDTGKTWALSDLKVGLSVASKDVAPTIHALHDELLLNVSPLQLRLLAALIDESRSKDYRGLPFRVVEANRATVHALVHDGFLEHKGYDCKNVPLELLGLPDWCSGIDFWATLRSLGIHILPAKNYYWSSPERGRTLFRVPLARPPEHIRVASEAFREVLTRDSLR
jgi:aspartate/methionine/tyrosine aminotransferase